MSPDLPPGPTRPRMLVVHGERGIRFSVADYFRFKGFQVTEAEDPAAARSLLDSTRFDVVLTDFHFARRGGEGLAVACAARTAARPPIVCLFAPPLDPDEAADASRAVDLLITRPRPLADVAQMLFALLQDSAAATLPPTT